MKKGILLVIWTMLFVIFAGNAACVAHSDSYKPKTIVSLTSFPERFPNLIKTLKSIKNQSVKADKIILYLSRQECTNGVPKEIKDYVEIHYVEDILSQNLSKVKWDGQRIKSYGKLIPALLEYPEDIIITTDDDIIYNKNCIKYLKDSYKKHPRIISAIDTMNADFSFTDNQYGEDYQMFEGIMGVLYPPHCFNDKDIFDINLALKEFPTTDDVYFWRCAMLNGTKAINPFGKARLDLRKYNFSRGAKSLWEINGKDNCKVNMIDINKVFVLNPELRKLFNFPEDGIYEINPACNTNKALDIARADTLEGAKLQLWRRNNGEAQKFKLTYHKEGYYTIEARCSGKMIGVPNSSKKVGVSLQQYTSNDTDAQKWYILPGGNGTFGLISKCNYLHMDAKCSNEKRGAPVQCCRRNSTNNQKFKFSKNQAEIIG